MNKRSKKLKDKEFIYYAGSPQPEQPEQPKAKRPYGGRKPKHGVPGTKKTLFLTPAEHDWILAWGEPGASYADCLRKVMRRAGCKLLPK